MTSIQDRHQAPLRTRGQLRKVLASCPEICEGHGGVRADLDRLYEYIREHGLRWAPTGALADHVTDEIGHVVETCSYSPGAMRRRAHYGRARLTGRAEYEHAVACIPPGLRTERGLLLTRAGRGRRQEWHYSATARKWLPGEIWIVSGPRLEARERRVGGRYGWKCVDSRQIVRLRVYEGGQIRRHATISVGGATRLTIWREVFRRWCHSPVQSVPVSDRLLRRLCPEGWSVVRSVPPSGGEPLFAYRNERGDEYHFAATLGQGERAVVGPARAAFRERASKRDEERIESLIHSGACAAVSMCLADSVRAGNCPVGSRRFAQAHGLDAARHYRLGDVLGVATPDERRGALLAAFAAVRRHEGEMRRGYSLLAEHQPSGNPIELVH